MNDIGMGRNFFIKSQLKYSNFASEIFNKMVMKGYFEDMYVPANQLI